MILKPFLKQPVHSF